MYADFFRCLVFAGLCSAIPATTRNDSSQLMDPNSPLQGFPADYSPLELSLSEYETYIRLESDRGESTSRWSSLATNFLRGLSKPLNPDPRWNLEQEIVYGDQNAPQGAELIASLATNIYDLWKDTANRPITRRIEAWKLPFANIRWVIDPTTAPGALLNPLKLGVVSLWVMRGVLERQAWPGYIHVRIWDSDPNSNTLTLEVGSLDILNIIGSPPFLSSSNTSISQTTQPSPNGENRASDSPSSPDSLLLHPINDIKLNNSLSAVQSGVKNVENRWLRCYSSWYWYAIAHFYSDACGNAPGFEIPEKSRSMRAFPCGHPKGMKVPYRNRNDRLKLWVYPAARPGGSTVLTWDMLVRGMIDWITRLAQGMRPIYGKYEIKVGETLLAEMNINIALDPINELLTID